MTNTSDPGKFCAAIEEWAELMIAREKEAGEDQLSPRSFTQAWLTFHLAVKKSCLLSRTVYGGERPSQTPCPVHKGKWRGIHWAWPGTFMTVIATGEKVPNRPEPMLQEWYDAGCRCFKHTCGCTTGWQPDEHCGCAPKPSACVPREPSDYVAEDSEG